jgi:hypothetical protein
MEEAAALNFTPGIDNEYPDEFNAGALYDAVLVNTRATGVDPFPWTLSVFAKV